VSIVRKEVRLPPRLVTSPHSPLSPSIRLLSQRTRSGRDSLRRGRRDLDDEARTLGDAHCVELHSAVERVARRRPVLLPEELHEIRRDVELKLGDDGLLSICDIRIVLHDDLGEVLPGPLREDVELREERSGKQVGVREEPSTARPHARRPTPDARRSRLVRADDLVYTLSFLTSRRKANAGGAPRRMHGTPEDAARCAAATSNGRMLFCSTRRNETAALDFVEQCDVNGRRCVSGVSLEVSERCMEVSERREGRRGGGEEVEVGTTTSKFRAESYVSKWLLCWILDIVGGRPLNEE
jgi:hypothetical protein